MFPGRRRPAVPNQTADCRHKREHTLRTIDLRVRPNRRTHQVGRASAGERPDGVQRLLRQSARGSLQSGLQAGHGRAAASQAVSAPGGLPEGPGAATVLHRIPRSEEGGGQVSREIRRGAAERGRNVGTYPFCVLIEDLYTYKEVLLLDQF